MCTEGQIIPMAIVSNPVVSKNCWGGHVKISGETLTPERLIY